MSVFEGTERAPVLDRVKGQPEVIRLLRGSLESPLHAYLFLGPRGTGKREAAIAFAAALLCPNGGCGECPSCEEALTSRHPDLAVIERSGPFIMVEQAEEVVHQALLTPRAARYHVLVLIDFDIIGGSAPALLKTIEEPPDTTVIIIVGETISQPFVTIASRCLRVQFKPLELETIVEVLVGEGAEAALSASAAEAAGGRLDRARLLVRDPGFMDRVRLWKTLPGQLDGTGARVAQLTDALLASVNEPLEVVRARQSEEIALLQTQAELRGERVIPGRKDLEDRHKREQRRVRTDELRAGLEALMSLYRERLTTPGISAQRLRTTLEAMAAVNEAATRLSRNVNETMLLQWLLLRLDT